jgi:hypothetical protein
MSVLYAPDDGWKYHPKRVEQFRDINKLCNIASCWIYIGIQLGAHPILHISRIRVKARDTRRITAAEMKYMRTTGYIWTDYRTNAQITRELKITQILDKLLKYKRNWMQHVNRMSRNTLPKVMKHYSPNWQKESWQAFEETSGYARPERVNKWPNSMTDI